MDFVLGHLPERLRAAARIVIASSWLARADRGSRDYSGSVVLPDGTEHWFSGWIKTSQKTGQRFLSVQIGKPKVEKTASGPRASLKTELNDDIPFAPEWR